MWQFIAGLGLGAVLGFLLAITMSMPLFEELEDTIKKYREIIHELHYHDPS